MRLRLSFLFVMLSFGISFAQPHGASTRGTPTIYNDQTAFLLAAGPTVMDTFETDATTAGCDSAGVLVLSSGPFTATADVPALKILEIPCAGNHNTTPGGQKYLGADTDLSGVSADVTFVFNLPLKALGLYLIDLDFANLEITIDGVAYPVPMNGDGGQSYFGIIQAQPFNTVTFQIVSAFDAHYSFDDVSYALSSPVSAGDGLEARSWSGVKSRYRE